MGFINPLFNDSDITNGKISKPKSIKPTKQIRSTRSDKTHNIKFPVDPIVQMKLKSLCKQGKRIYRLQGKGDLKQTKFNTLLLTYGLKHKELVHWNHHYKDTKVYMHTQLLENEYELLIGGPHGIAIQMNLSERKVVFQIMMSVLKWIEGGNSDLEEII